MHLAHHPREEVAQDGLADLLLHRLVVHGGDDTAVIVDVLVE